MKLNLIHSLSLNRFELIFTMLIMFGMFAYIFAAMKNKSWPKSRYVFWVVGLLCVLVSVIGPIAKLGHHHFVIHMIMHLLLGMLAPLLIALARPITLVLISLKIKQARILSRFFRSSPIRLLTNPIFTALLNIGGLWLLYTTELYSLMHENIFLLIFVHIHLFLAGYLFTISIIAIEPISHKYSYLFRSVIMIFALAGHDILSKYLFANSLENVAVDEAKLGAELMYYGGDFIDLFIILILCLNWYKPTSTYQYKAVT